MGVLGYPGVKGDRKANMSWQLLNNPQDATEIHRKQRFFEYFEKNPPKVNRTRCAEVNCLHPCNGPPFASYCFDCYLTGDKKQCDWCRVYPYLDDWSEVVRLPKEPESYNMYYNDSTADGRRPKWFHMDLDNFMDKGEPSIPLEFERRVFTPDITSIFDG